MAAKLATPINLALAKVRVVYCGQTVGLLARTEEGTLAFEYASSWLRDGFSISPLSLPLERRVFVASPHPLDGVFGVFDDSLPDGWGRLLVDRLLKEHGIDPYEVNPLVRLSIVGKSGMGALEYEPSTPLAPDSSLDNLDEIAEECKRLLKTDFSDDLDALFALGGSSGGARPKILTKVDGQDWIIKFPSSFDPSTIGQDEFRMAELARACGIEMPETRLFPSNRCGGYFGVKRFDRATDQHGTAHKLHMASVGALLETSHRIPNLDYAMLMKLTWALTDEYDQIERLYRLMCFNAFAGNRDDHAKSFTFLHGLDEDSWTLSPAYDLTQNAGMNGEHSTTVGGKGKDIGLDDLVTVGTDAGISPARARVLAHKIRDIVGSELPI